MLSLYLPTSSVRNKVLEIIRTYRNLSVLGTEIKIETLNKSGDVYMVRGEYSDRGFLQSYEQGTFEITLDAKDLKPIAVKISPVKNR